MRALFLPRGNEPLSARRIFARAFAAFALLAATAGAADRKLPARPPDGSYFYVIALNGTQIAAYTSVVSGTGKPAIAATQIFERALLGKTSASSTLTFDPRSLHEIAYRSVIENPSGSVPERYSAVVADDVLTVAYEGAEFPLRPLPSAPSLVIDDDLGPSDLFVPAMLNASRAKLASLVLVRSGEVTLLRVLPNDIDARPPSVPATDASVALSYQTDHTIREVYWYDPQTFVVHDLVVPGATIEVRLTAFVPPP